MSSCEHSIFSLSEPLDHLDLIFFWLRLDVPRPLKSSDICLSWESRVSAIRYVWPRSTSTCGIFESSSSNGMMHASSSALLPAHTSPFQLIDLAQRFSCRWSGALYPKHFLESLDSWKVFLPLLVRGTIYWCIPGSKWKFWGLFDVFRKIFGFFRLDFIKSITYFQLTVIQLISGICVGGLSCY